MKHSIQFKWDSISINLLLKKLTQIQLARSSILIASPSNNTENMSNSTFLSHEYAEIGIFPDPNDYPVHVIWEKVYPVTSRA